VTDTTGYRSIPPLVYEDSGCYNWQSARGRQVRRNQERIKATYLNRAIDFIDFLIGLMIQLELRFNERLDVERLHRAVSLALVLGQS
jgi:hypothetical protein